MPSDRAACLSRSPRVLSAACTQDSRCRAVLSAGTNSATLLACVEACRARASLARPLDGWSADLPGHVARGQPALGDEGSEAEVLAPAEDALLALHEGPSEAEVLGATSVAEATMDETRAGASSWEAVRARHRARLRAEEQQAHTAQPQEHALHAQERQRAVTDHATDAQHAAPGRGAARKKTAYGDDALG